MSIPTLTLFARGGFAGPGFFFPFLILLLVGGLALWLFRRRNGARTVKGSAMDALQERFARGEIDQAEYEHRKAVLVGADIVPPPTGGTGTDE